MSFGLYFHIPFCLQKCHYCDFATLPVTDQNKMSDYTRLLLLELRTRHAAFLDLGPVHSIYFGGGTPSLLPAEDILTLVQAVNNLGFQILPDAEITIEINPGTIDQKKLDLYRAAGVNRYSVGVQTFHDDLLKRSGREHTAQSSRETLTLLKDNQMNYSFDLLFGQSGQTLSHLRTDLEELLYFQPPHVSAYLMTLPENHFLNAGRAPDDEQVEMFNFIRKTLESSGWAHYEISNYCRPNSHSRHNSGYWNDQPYWGVGLSAHSYRPDWGDYGTRFWNSKNLTRYTEECSRPMPPEKNVEVLKRHEALTDFLHTQLRKKSGLETLALRSKFKDEWPLAEKRLERLVATGWLESSGTHYCLREEKKVLANHVFFELTFLPEELTLK